MTWFTRLTRLGRGERGTVAFLAAASLTALVGISGAAVDLGVWFNARGELQNAADAAALAGAATMLTADASQQAVAQAATGIATAKEVAGQNQVLGSGLTLLDQDITIGFYDLATASFDPDRTGTSVNPDDLTAIRVRTRRDDLANGPVATYFAGIVGVAEVGVSATSTAYLGYAGSTQEGQVDLPIAVNADKVGGGNGGGCGTTLRFRSEGTETSEWTTFFTWPANNPNVDSYVQGSLPAPALAVGDEISVVNGQLSNTTFEHLVSRFQAEGEDTDGDGEADHWRVLLPVIDEQGGSCGCATAAAVTGFMYFVITQVNTAPAKEVYGYLECGMVVPDSRTGGGNFGARASYPKLVR